MIIECGRAALDEPLGSAFLVNQPPGAATVQGRHELVFGLERDRVEPRVRDAQLGFNQPGLPRHDDERGLGRVALDAPAVLVTHELCVVAEQAGLEALGQSGMPRQARRRPPRSTSPRGS